eukprot:5559985-Pleurochrysis_carterae.AAC.1
MEAGVESDSDANDAHTSARGPSLFPTPRQRAASHSDSDPDEDFKPGQGPPRSRFPQHHGGGRGNTFSPSQDMARPRPSQTFSQSDKPAARSADSAEAVLSYFSLLLQCE